ncbi:MAG: mannose-phosphate guanylyltransferase [Bacteroidales bacterium]|nr:mannose-phosphate guanylyltransferase [Bacteroidales bacterium]
MKAMIFAAGKGTRLKPLTNSMPKALVKINGIPMLERVIQKLIQSGVNEIIINVHHFAGQIINFLKENDHFGIRIEISHEKDELLDTGGGLKKTSWFFNDNKPFILHNVDILSNIDLAKMLEYHQHNNALATLAVRERKSSRYFLFNHQNRLCGWQNVKTGEIMNHNPSNATNKLAFSGIHIINPEIFDYWPDSSKFSIVKTYLDLSQNHPIIAFPHNQDYWYDIGKPDSLKEADAFFNNQ